MLAKLFMVAPSTKYQLLYVKQKEAGMIYFGLYPSIYMITRFGLSFGNEDVCFCSLLFQSGNKPYE
jgi:hypothetical protein